jgi:hypothetical protein
MTFKHIHNATGTITNTCTETNVFMMMAYSDGAGVYSEWYTSVPINWAATTIDRVMFACF